MGRISIEEYRTEASYKRAKRRIRREDAVTIELDGGCLLTTLPEALKHERDKGKTWWREGDPYPGSKQGSSA